uniref:Uncharacterized protein n=2 Tax=Clytia hemisphaerica TaxID=252671 RepID=A0A7M5UUD6_9CNID
FLVVNGCYLATVNASSDENCPSNERLVECCNNAPREKRGGPWRRQKNFQLVNMIKWNGNSVKLHYLKIFQLQRRNELSDCKKNYNDQRLKLKKLKSAKKRWRRGAKIRDERHECKSDAKLKYRRRLVRLAWPRKYRRQRGQPRGCCCRAGNRRSENTNNKSDDEDEKKNEGDEMKYDEDDEEVLPEFNEAEEEKNEEQEKPKDCKTTSGNCCSALEALGDDTKADDNLANDVKALFENLVSKISEANDDTDVVTLETVFEDYVELSKCSAKKGVSVDTKNDLAEMLNMQSPKLTMELFGNPRSYYEEMEFILEKIDDSVFGKAA